MSTQLFRLLVAALGAAFFAGFLVVVGPALLKSPDVFAAFAAGFVNPFASGYAMDAIACWCLLVVWVIYEAGSKGVRHGWVAILLGLVPGVATGMAVYLLLRLRHEHIATAQAGSTGSSTRG